MTRSETLSENTATAGVDNDQSCDPEKTHDNGLADQTFYLAKRKLITIFLACASTEVVALLDEKGVAAALSIVSSELGAGSKISWVASAYFLQDEYGRVSDIYSRKTVLFALIAVFFVGSFAASFAQTVVQLVVFRAVTGVGGGGVILLGQLIVGDVVSVRERDQGILGAFVALSNGIGPLIGAAYAQKASWRWIFRMNVPLAVCAAACVYFFMPLKKVWRSKLKKVDFVGSLLVLVGTGSMMYVQIFYLQVACGRRLERGYVM